MFLIKLLFVLTLLLFLSFFLQFSQLVYIKIFIIFFLSSIAVILVLLFFRIKSLKTFFFNQKITEEALISSEQKYQSMVENIPIGFARSTPGAQGQYMEVNSFFANMLGYSKEELIKMPVSELYKDKHKRQEFSNRICKVSLVKDEEVQLSKKDGSIITVFVTGQAIRDENDAIVYFDLILEDVTQKKFNNEESIKNEKLTSIGILAGGIAHDFNNILTGLYGNIALAKLELDASSEAAQLIHDAELSMTKATDLTQQLLVFAKGGDPIKETIPLGQTIKDTAKFNLSGSNVKLDIHIDDLLWHAHVDKAQITQVISNLVINARHAMPDGGIVSISAHNCVLKTNEIAELNAGDYLKITVHDQGIGIPEECMSQIFDPYFTTKHTGSGMGLATSFSIIKKHKGWITSVSKPGNGATFEIFLPADVKKEDHALLDTDSNVSGKASANILIMDDDDQICVIAQKMIKRFGYQSTAVHDGKLAIQAYEHALKNNEPFDLVLMDLTIPGGMGGKEAILKILDIHPDAKAVVISGYSNDLVLANYHDYGFKGMLVKPFKMEQLQHTIDKVLG